MGGTLPRARVLLNWKFSASAWHGPPQHGSVGWQVTKMSLKIEVHDKKSNFIVLIVKNRAIFRTKPRFKCLAHNLH
jgi:hypothetical protein